MATAHGRWLQDLMKTLLAGGEVAQSSGAPSLCQWQVERRGLYLGVGLSAAAPVNGGHKIIKLSTTNQTTIIPILLK